MSPPVGRTRAVARRRAVTGCLVACLAAVAGCDTGGSEQRAERSAGQQRPGAATPQEPAPRTTAASSPRPLAALPRTPPTDDAAGLASHLQRVEAVLRSPRSRAADERRAGEFEQLAARMLAAGPDRYAEAVLARLPPAVRAKTRAHVEAAALLDAMGGPVATFPDWRIVDPPPARVLIELYKSAGRQVGVPWQYLAAVHLVETRMGRIRGVSTAGAQGPMQFIPGTWDIYGRGGDVTDPRDAIFAAARLLRDHGAPGDMAQALWHYNPSSNYVGAVSRYAEQIRKSPSAYRGYWNWRVLYEHVDGTVVLEEGYPQVPPRRVRGAG